jgi:hypothetical protein
VILQLTPARVSFSGLASCTFMVPRERDSRIVRGDGFRPELSYRSNFAKTPRLDGAVELRDNENKSLRLLGRGFLRQRELPYTNVVLPPGPSRPSLACWGTCVPEVVPASAGGRDSIPVHPERLFDICTMARQQPQWYARRRQNWGTGKPYEETGELSATLGGRRSTWRDSHEPFCTSPCAAGTRARGRRDENSCWPRVFG